MKRFEIDLNTAPAEFPHTWKRCVGSGHAALALREDWRRQMRRCREEIGFEYVRFHGLLCDDMSTCYGTAVDDEGVEHPLTSFFNVDSIFDFLLAIGVRPFIELSFMPTAIASGDQTCFHYRGNVTPPKDYRLWGELIEALTGHLVERYGIDEVRTWPFEVWNEPNLGYFFAGDMDEYWKLYTTAAEAVKRVDDRIPVGGPSTAGDAWIEEIIDYCKTSGTPLDFVSTHHYPTDFAVGDHSNMEARMAACERGFCGKQVREIRTQAGDLPLHYTEWHNSPSSRDEYHDRPFSAAFVAKTNADVAGVVDSYSIWTFSDIFEENNMPSEPFHGGFGLLTLHDVAKPTYRAYQLLSRSGDERYEAFADDADGGTVDVLATRPGEKELLLLITNHNVPLSPIADQEVEIVVDGCAAAGAAMVERIDDDHANGRRAWEQMGRPTYPTDEQIAELQAASELKAEKLDVESADGKCIVKLTVPAHGTAAVTVPLK